MFGIFKSKHRRTVESAANELSEGFAKVCEAINLQLDLLMFFDGKQRGDFLADTYFVRYAFGMFDAVTTILGLQLRQKLGRGLMERFFVGYMTAEFKLDDAGARKLFDTLLELYNKEGPRDAAIMDGGSDGVTRLQGGETNRLLHHFGFFGSDAELTPAQIQEFRIFHERDRFASPPNT